MSETKTQTRHTLRKNAMIAIYQHLLSGKDIKQAVYDICGNEVDGFLYTITIEAMQHKDRYIESINKALRKDWTFNRLGYVEQAILLIAACELDLEHAARSIIINEAITLAKQYCDDEAYKLINGVLDKL